ncbi:MAG: NADH-quinone oxidoreductase subunit NuoK [Cytophagales bacterium]|nr:NADH-quinone oxidoreductase subunit NuoK [Bernardetiaceae bacterium]MDW8203964.1 NADH-quinone oxidoreductase subunit NuoK [Cytophagales bacterium]
MWHAITPLHYAILSAIIFCIGIMVAITKRNIIGVLMGLELMLNAANINLITTWQHAPKTIEGQVFALFVIAIAAAESALALAIAYQVFRRFGTVSLDSIANMKG